jgi:hypothetical protein
MKNQRLLHWVIFVSDLIVSVALCFVSVGVGIATGDCARCGTMPPPPLLADIDMAIWVLGFPFVPLGKMLAKSIATPGSLNFVVGVILYVANGWVLAHWLSVGIAGVTTKIRAKRSCR